MFTWPAQADQADGVFAGGGDLNQAVLHPGQVLPAGLVDAVVSGGLQVDAALDLNTAEQVDGGAGTGDGGGDTDGVGGGPGGAGLHRAGHLVVLRQQESDLIAGAELRQSGLRRGENVKIVAQKADGVRFCGAGRAGLVIACQTGCPRPGWYWWSWRKWSHHRDAYPWRWPDSRFCKLYSRLRFR